MDTKVYEGAIPTDGTHLHPGANMEGEPTGVPGGGGFGRINATKDEGDVTRGYMQKKDYLDAEGYQGKDTIDDSPSCTYRNPDDISKADSGKMP
jgi:hypothetical protein